MDENFFGPFYFEVLTTLRNSIFINSILSNSSVWYNVKKEEIKLLERCDAQIMALGLSSNMKTSTVMMYLEMGWVPIPFILMSRRLLYLYHILTEEEQSLIYNFFKVQWSSPLKGDWA